jgi:hypothetical protein
MDRAVPNIVNLAKTLRLAGEQLDEIRKAQIRESSIVKSLDAFDSAFKAAIADPLPRPIPTVSPGLRVLLGIDK